MLKLVLGAAGSGKTAYIISMIKKAVEEKTGGQYLIVPEQYSHEAERELCLACGDSLSLYAEVLSFSRLALRVEQELGTGGKVPLDKGGRLLSMTLALRQGAPFLRLYSAAAHKPELQMQLMHTVEELKMARVSGKALLEASEKAQGGLSEKLYDLALCLEGYEAVLSAGHTDPADRLFRLSEIIGQSSVGNLGHIYIDGFTDFTGSELEVIAALLKKDAEITVCLSCDSLEADSEHFEPSRKTARTLLRLAAERGIDSEIISFDRESEKNQILGFFQERLFHYTEETMEAAGGALTLIRCDNIRAECEMAASRCLSLVREKDCRWRDIAIAVRGFDDYSAALSQTFSLYGIPLFIARRESILQKSVPNFIKCAFEVIFGSWDRDAVSEYMKTGLCGISREDCDLLDSYALMWNIRGSQWYREKPWTQNPRGLSVDECPGDRLLLQRLDAARRALSLPLETLYKNGKKALTAEEQAQVLYDFLLRIDLPERLQERSAFLEEAGFALLSAELSQIWELIVSSLEQLSALLGDLPLSQDEFSRLYLRQLSQYEVSAIPISADSVAAGDMDRMRRRHIKHLFILGASDERLPGEGAGGGLLSSEEREELSFLGLPLGGGIEDISREFSLVYNCVSLPSESIIISYPAFQNDGSGLRPSFLINRAKALFNMETEIFSLSEARLSAKSPAYIMAVGDKTKKGELAREYFLKSDGGKEKLRELSQRVSADRGRLSEDSLISLYGKELSISPSRADAFSACRFSYFLRYGLGLKERERASFDAPELGTFMHYVLENAANEIASSGGFKNAGEAYIEAVTEKHIQAYIREKLGSLEDKSPRFIYLFSRLRPSVSSVVSDMVRELSRSDFVPLDFELSFMKGGDEPQLRIEGGKTPLNINGIADRVDGCLIDGVLYLRVIDYKTGKKSFSLSDIYYGMGMQMLLYLFALETQGERRYGNPVAPAGVLYVPAKDPLISAPSDLADGELAKQRAKARQRSGLILNSEKVIRAMEGSDEPEYIPLKYKKDGSVSGDSLAGEDGFSLLKTHTEKKLLELSEAISQGSIDARPYYRGEQENACLFCPYGSVCRFDEEKDQRHYLAKLKPEEFWSRLEDEK